MKQTKEAITKKALELYRENGFDNVSIETICEACGVTTGAFYYYFKSKRDVLMNAIYTSLEAKDDVMSRLLEEPSRYEQVWMMYEDRNRRRVELGPEILKQVWINNIERGGRNADPMNEHWKGATESTDLVLKLIRIGQKSGEIRRDRTPEELHRAFLYMKTALLINWAAKNGCFDVMGELRKGFELLFAPAGERT